MFIKRQRKHCKLIQFYNYIFAMFRVEKLNDIDITIIREFASSLTKNDNLNGGNLHNGEG